jgi:hypothetical protein
MATNCSTREDPDSRSKIAFRVFSAANLIDITRSLADDKSGGRTRAAYFSISYNQHEVSEKQMESNMFISKTYRCLRFVQMLENIQSK